MWWMCGLSLLLSASIIPVVIFFCRKYGIYDTPNQRKIHTGNIPRLGSLGFVPAFVISVILYFSFFTKYSLGYVLPIVIAGFIIFLFGVIDDFLNLRAKFKLFVQMIAAFIIVSSGYRFTRICDWILPLWISYLLTFCWIIGVVNSFNLIDGLDGLCGGLSFLVIGTLGIIFYRSAQSTSAICFIMCAAILGFLIYNKPRAVIFMGDGGSQFLGFMVAALPLYQSSDNYEYNKFLIMVLLASIPLLDTIAAIWRRTREHRSFFTPDRAHLHHKLMNIGYSTAQILFILLSLQLLLCIISCIAMYFQNFHGAILLCIGLIIISAFFCIIHFTNRAVNRMIVNNKVQNQKPAEPDTSKD